jgi:hypothetical protein
MRVWGCLFWQLREQRRAAQSAAAAAAKNTLRKESEWMRRQPKARSTKAAARVRQFYELTAKAKDLPQAATRVAFDAGDGAGMRRQVRCPPLVALPHTRYSLPSACICSCRRTLFQQAVRCLAPAWYLTGDRNTTDA